MVGDRPRQPWQGGRLRPDAPVDPVEPGLDRDLQGPASGERVLLFRDGDSLKRLIDENDLESYERYYDEAIRGDASADSPIVAIQPGTRIDIEKDFYLVPIKAGIRQLARDRGVALWVMHLKTPMGMMDHQRAEQRMGWGFASF